MTHPLLSRTLSGDALRQSASTENSPDVFSVGGLLCELGMIVGQQVGRTPTSSLAFGRWLELARRDKRLTLVDIASQTGVELDELVQIERGEAAIIQPRTVFQLASVFSVDSRRLGVLAGLIQDQPGNPLRSAAVRFAAQSESMAQLSQTEHEALNEFVRLLASSER